MLWSSFPVFRSLRHDWWVVPCRLQSGASRRHRLSSLSPSPPPRSGSLRSPGSGTGSVRGKPGTGQWWWWWWTNRPLGWSTGSPGWRLAAEGCVQSPPRRRNPPPPHVLRSRPQTRTRTARGFSEWPVACRQGTSSCSVWARGPRTCSGRLEESIQTGQQSLCDCSFVLFCPQRQWRVWNETHTMRTR